MEHIHHIRYEHKVNRKSFRAIARETGHDVKTVKKYVEMEDFSPREPRKFKRSSKSDKYEYCHSNRPAVPIFRPLNA